MIGRRDFLTLTGAATLAAPLRALAQRAQMKRVGFLLTLPASDLGATRFAEALKKGLGGQGWIEGGNLLIDYRFGSQSQADAQRYARELIDLKPDVLVSVGGNNGLALVAGTKTIPIIFGQIPDTIARSAIGDLAHPRTNVTGFLNVDDTTISGKWVELLKELQPAVARAAFIYVDGSVGGRYLPAFDAAAAKLGITSVHIELRQSSDITSALAGLAQGDPAGVVVPNDAFLLADRQTAFLAVAAAHLAAVWGNILYAIDGAPVVYTIDSFKQVQGGGDYAGRVLNGEKIANLPAQLPLQYSLFINLRTAKAQGLEVPQSLVARADQVIA